MTKRITATQTINKGDWSGDEVTITIDVADRSFELMGYTFRLDVATEFDGYVIASDEFHADLGIVWLFEGSFTAMQDFECPNVQRSSTDLFTAAVQYLCNVV